MEVNGSKIGISDHLSDPTTKWKVFFAMTNFCENLNVSPFLGKSLPPGVQKKRERLEDRSRTPGSQKVQNMLGLIGLTASDVNFSISWF